MILDALDSTCWAWILLKYGTEKRVHRYCEWLKGLTRRNTQRLPEIKTLWEAFSWEIAVQMRSKISFDKITENLMQDLATVNDTLMQSPAKKPHGESKDGGYRRMWTKPPKGKGKNWRKWSYSQKTASPPAPNNYGSWQSLQHLPPQPPNSAQWTQQPNTPATPQQHTIQAPTQQWSTTTRRLPRASQARTAKSGKARARNRDSTAQGRAMTLEPTR